MEHYNYMHRRGKKYSREEVRARRNQVYDEHTSHLVPLVSYRLMQERNTLPDVGFHIQHLAGRYPVKAHVTIRLAQGSAPPSMIPSAHYDGKHAWNLNPGCGFGGHFALPPEIRIDRSERIRARIDVTLVDIYDRAHPLLPVGYIHGLGQGDCWYAEASLEELDIPVRPGS
jgi:hypothetical protein